MNRQKILIVDDSEMNREMLKAILGEGYKYAEAVDGAQALRMLQQDMHIDLVLLDINMPKMDGFAVLEHMNQFRWIDEIPVIMISAADDRESIKRCYSLGVAFMGNLMAARCGACLKMRFAHFLLARINQSSRGRFDLLCLLELIVFPKK